MKFTLQCSGTFVVPGRSLFVIVGSPNGGRPDKAWNNITPASSDEWLLHSDWWELIDGPCGPLLAFVVPYIDEAALKELTALSLHGRELRVIPDWTRPNLPLHDPLPPLDQMQPIPNS